MSEAHSAALGGHFIMKKIIQIPKEHFYWPILANYVHNNVSECTICHRAKALSTKCYTLHF